VAATRLDAIAAAANVTKPVLYRHFDSKKTLYVALLVKHIEQLSQFVDPAGRGATRSVPATVPGRWFAYVQERGGELPRA
jgi:AcrR family transcriptional regulator